MRIPRADVLAGRGAQAVEHLQAILAWLADGQLVTRLPDHWRRVVVPASSKIDPLGAWSGLRWVPARASGDEREIVLEPGRPHHLVFSPKPGRGFRLQIEDVAGTAEESLIGRAPDGRPPGWHALAASLPETRIILPGSALFRPGRTELTDEISRTCAPLAISSSRIRPQALGATLTSSSPSP